MTKTLPAHTATPETKVTVSTVATYLGSVAILAVVEAAGTPPRLFLRPPGCAEAGGAAFVRSGMVGSRPIDSRMCLALVPPA